MVIFVMDGDGFAKATDMEKGKNNSQLSQKAEFELNTRHAVYGNHGDRASSEFGGREFSEIPVLCSHLSGSGAQVCTHGDLLAGGPEQPRCT